MKENRPTGPGIYWYKNNYDGGIDGTLVGRPYGRRSGPLMVFHLEDDGWSTMEHFEDCEVSEWLGSAHPPKKVDRYTASSFPMIQSLEPQEYGPLVFYEDVKEFLLKD